MGYIYKITNQINQKIYIGKTTKTIEERFSEHKKKAKQYSNRHLYNAMNYYGFNNFTIDLIGEYPNDILDQQEIYWIQYYNSTDPNIGYNLTIGGDGGNTWNNNTNKELYSEHLRQAQLGNKYVPMTKESLLQDLQEQKTFTELKQKYNCTKNTLINRLELYFQKTPEELGLIPNPFAKKEIDKNLLYQDLQANKLTNKEISAKYNISTTTLSVLCHEYFNQTPNEIRGGRSKAQQEAFQEIKKRGKQEGWYKGKNSGSYKQLDEQKLLEMIQNGDSIETIANFFHISKPTVTAKAKEYFGKTVRELRRK